MALTGDILTYEPSCAKAADFHRSLARIRQLAGGNRSSKSTTAAADMVMVACGYHPARSELGRFRRPGKCWAVSLDYRVSFGVMEPIVRQLLPKDMIERDDVRERIITLTNGWQIEFKSCDAGREKLQGASVSYVLEDEEPEEGVHKELLARTVDCRGDIVLAMTPLLGETWSREQILEPFEEGRIAFDEDGNPDVACWQISVYENRHISRFEIERMTRGLAPHEIESRVYGRYATAEGRVFPEFNPAVHCAGPGGGELDVLRRLAAEPWLERIIGMDHGSGRGHTAAYLLTRAADGVVHVQDEYYEPLGVPVKQHVAGLRALADRNNVAMPVVYLDPAAKQVGMELGEHGIMVAKANNDRRSGISRIREAMWVDAVCGSGLKIYPACKHLIRDLPRYSWRPRRPSDDGLETVKKIADHSIDALRYGLMALPARSLEPMRVGIGKAPEQMMADYMNGLIAASVRKRSGDEYYGRDGLG